MAVTGAFYHSMKLKMGEGDFDFSADTIKAMLVDNTYTPNAAVHAVKADITGELSTGFGYTSGGVTLTTVTWALAAGVVKLDADDITLAAVGGSIGPARYLVVYDDSAGADELMFYLDFGADLTAGDGTNFVIKWDNTNGLFKLQ